VIEEVVREESPRERAEMERLAELAELDAPELIAEANAMHVRMEEQGLVLREARESAGLSVSDLAARACLDEEWLERLEAGWQSPTLVQLERIASIVGKAVELRFVDAA
jgi:ribosome-binding protein aMBF1 (putative translation factor)